MRLYLFFATVLALLVVKIGALHFLHKALILHDYPLCATICSGKVAEKLGVSFFDAEGNCARINYQTEWRKCINRGCFREDRHRVWKPSETRINGRQLESCRIFVRVMG